MVGRYGRTVELVFFFGVNLKATPKKEGVWSSEIINGVSWLPLIHHLYIANWMIIYHLPPIRGTRNNHLDQPPSATIFHF